MSLTIENEKSNRSFLDVEIIYEAKIFTTFVYYKPTFSEVYTHFDNFLQTTYKFGIVYTVAYIQMLPNNLKLD